MNGIEATRELLIELTQAGLNDVAFDDSDEYQRPGSARNSVDCEPVVHAHEPSSMCSCESKQIAVRHS